MLICYIGKTEYELNFKMDLTSIMSLQNVYVQLCTIRHEPIRDNPAKNKRETAQKQARDHFCIITTHH